MWVFKQSTGELFHDGEVMAMGYSGRDNGKNCPDMQSVHDVGPIPCGMWHIVYLLSTTVDHGPYVLTLTPAKETNTFGRSGFLIHGESIAAPGTASHGCIILPRIVREAVWNSNDRDLGVIA